VGKGQVKIGQLLNPRCFAATLSQLYGDSSTNAENGKRVYHHNENGFKAIDITTVHHDRTNRHWVTLKIQPTQGFSTDRKSIIDAEIHLHRYNALYLPDCME
jgi:hypothetical protein